MRKTVCCRRCHTNIGSILVICYPENGPMAGKIDYGDLKGNEDYGGEHEGEYLCHDCYEEAVNKKAGYDDDF